MADPVKNGYAMYVNPPQVGIADAPLTVMEDDLPPVPPDPTLDTVPNPISDQAGANRHKGKHEVVIAHTDTEPNPITDPVTGMGGRSQKVVAHSED